jgi:hypothetical protein
MLDHVYRAVAWQCIDKFRYNIYITKELTLAKICTELPISELQDIQNYYFIHTVVHRPFVGQGPRSKQPDGGRCCTTAQ